MKIIERPSAKGARGAGVSLRFGVHPFAVGKILVALSDEGLCWLGLDCTEARLRRDWPRAILIADQTGTKKVAGEIARLWPEKLESLSVPLVLHGTPFQIKIWRALLKIRSGDTATYGDIAKKIGLPLAARAVGTAVGCNPVSIVVPCHRVVNKNAAIVNYGWGAPLKKALLKGEGVIT